MRKANERKTGREPGQGSGTVIADTVRILLSQPTECLTLGMNLNVTTAFKSRQLVEGGSSPVIPATHVGRLHGKVKWGSLGVPGQFCLVPQNFSFKNNHKASRRASSGRGSAHLHGMQCAGKSRRRADSDLLPSTGAHPPPPAHSHWESSDLGEKQRVKSEGGQGSRLLEGGAGLLRWALKSLGLPHAPLESTPWAICGSTEMMALGIFRIR